MNDYTQLNSSDCHMICYNSELNRLEIEICSSWSVYERKKYTTICLYRLVELPDMCEHLKSSRVTHIGQFR